MALNMTDRTDAGALIPTEHAREIIQSTTEGSAALRLMRRLPNMSRKTREQPVLTAMAQAYFVNGDDGLKDTTKAEWDKVSITAEEIAVIVPVPDAVISDADYDIWAEIRPQIVEAFGRKIDAAMLFGIDKPASWPTGIVPAAVAAGNAVTLGTGVDLYDDLLAPGGVIALVEEDGYLVNGHIGAISLRARLRGLRDNEGRPLFNNVPGMPISPYAIDGEPIIFPRNGVFQDAQLAGDGAELISGDWDKARFAIRQDLTFEIFKEGVISDGDGKVLLNLMQQDAKAVRVVMRLGWAKANPINRVNPDANTRFPFGVLLSEG